MLIDKKFMVYLKDRYFFSIFFFLSDKKLNSVFFFDDFFDILVYDKRVFIVLGTILEIIENSVLIKLSIDINNQPNLVNLHVVFDDGKKKIIGEIVNVTQTQMTANIVGEMKDNNFTPGATSKPSFKSLVRLIKLDELTIHLGEQETKIGQTNFGTSNVYEGYKINVSINDFFSNHFSILGNSGAGKSCTVASILQKLFTSSPTPPINANLFFFDAYGEYTNAFSKLHEKNAALWFVVPTVLP